MYEETIVFRILGTQVDVFFDNIEERTGNWECSLRPGLCFGNRHQKQILIFFNMMDQHVHKFACTIRATDSKNTDNLQMCKERHDC